MLRQHLGGKGPTVRRLGALVVSCAVVLAACTVDRDDGTTTTSTAGTTTAPSVTTTSVAPTSTTTTSTTIIEGSLELRGDGIGVARFGDDPDSVIAVVESLLGPPDDDTGFVSDRQVVGFCGPGQQRSVRWGDLSLGFVDQPVDASSAAPVGFIAYVHSAVTIAGGELTINEEPTPELTTETGLALLDDVTTARRLYGEAVGEVEDHVSRLGHWVPLDLEGPWSVKLWLDESTTERITRIESSPCGE